jgi:thiamine-phosphate pyrophosphorylase
MSQVGYLITDPEFYSYDTTKFAHTLTQAFIKYTPEFACFRYKSEFSNKEDLAKVFINISAEYGIKSVVNSDINTAIKLDAYGVHLPSARLNDIRRARSLGLCVFASAHNMEEAKFCEAEGADFITLSPVFVSPNKGEPLGLQKFTEMVASLDVKVFALGGIITAEQIDALSTSGAHGFASIRYFVD